MNGGLNPCQCCGEPTISEPDGYEICDVCGWEDDYVQNRDPDYAGGANQMSLKEARAYWQSTQNRVTASNRSPEMDAIQQEAQRLLGAGQ
jgi:hypothetical protein